MPPSISVATVLTVYGIETFEVAQIRLVLYKLQQHLPFTVLKLSGRRPHYLNKSKVATVPTVYGIETVQVHP